MDDKLKSYLENNLPIDSKWVKNLEDQAKKEFIPIMDRLSMNFMMQMIRIIKPNRILEIGTAIGYSALRMLQAYPNVEIITIEQDEHRYHEAIKNIELNKCENQIKVIHGDALEEIPKLSIHKSFDLIFIDAAKGKYRYFFEMSAPLLNEGGVILSDNVLFRGYIADSTNVDPKYKKLVTKIKDYNKWLIDLPNFSTSIVPVGDGVAISYKENNEGGH